MTDHSHDNHHRMEQLATDVDWREVARLLGYPPDRVPDRVLDTIRVNEERAAFLIEPVGVYALVDPAEAIRSDYLPDGEAVIVAAVSIGEGLERVVEQERMHGRLVSALILDAYGSAAVEAAADSAEASIKRALAGEGLRCSRRFSPGYGGWDVTEQRWILEVLRGEEIGISLTEGCMMIPRKSVTFAVTVGKNPIEMREENICASCGAVDCRWRNTPERCPGGRTR